MLSVERGGSFCALGSVASPQPAAVSASAKALGTKSTRHARVGVSPASSKASECGATLSDLNSHIRMFGPMAMVHGNTVTYLSCLRDAVNRHRSPVSGEAERRREKFGFVEFATK